MLISFEIFGLFIYILGVIRFSLKHKHLLLILLRLEFIVVALFFSIILILIKYDYEFYFSIIFLTIRVCEGALGLSILVSLIRTHGNDYFNLFNLLW